MKPLKIVFFGTPEFAKTSLEAIHNSAHKVVGVVTVADKANGRGQKINQSPVKIYAEEQQIPIFQPEKLRNPEFLNTIQELNADVFVVVAFRMMPEKLFSMPPLGTFNLHGSLLPDYRGAAPINYAVMNGETETGVTTFFINEKIDEGNILLQEKTAISPDENAGSLHDRLMQIGAKLVVKTLDELSENQLIAKPQPSVQEPKNAFKIFKNDTLINWEKSGEEIYNFVRGLSPYPAAFTKLMIGNESKTLKIYSGKLISEEHNQEFKSLEINKNDFKIYLRNGIYLPEEVQIEGKKRMNVRDFLNGIRDFSEIKLA